MINKSSFEKNGGTYRMVNGYKIPNLDLPEEAKKPLGRWGQAHLEYLSHNKKVLLTTMLAKGMSILDICKETNCELKIMPSVYAFATDDVTAKSMQDVAVEVDTIAHGQRQAHRRRTFERMRQGQEGEPTLITRRFDIAQNALQVGHDVQVREHHALRTTRRTGRVDQSGQIVFFEFSWRVFETFGVGQPISQLRHGDTGVLRHFTFGQFVVGDDHAL